MRKKTQSTARPARRSPEPSLGSPVAAPLSEVEAQLALAAPAVKGPSLQVKARLMERIRAAKTAAAKPAPAIPPGWRFESARTPEGWREPFPGVRFKTLSLDEERDVVMLLVEMAPGSRFPDHPHDVSADEGVVITGDVDMDGRLMLPGDYYYAGLGTNHVNITSPSGCTALLSLRASAWRQWRTTLTAK